MSARRSSTRAARGVARDLIATPASLHLSLLTQPQRLAARFAMQLARSTASSSSLSIPSLASSSTSTSPPSSGFSYDAPSTPTTPSVPSARHDQIRKESGTRAARGVVVPVGGSSISEEMWRSPKCSSALAPEECAQWDGLAKQQKRGTQWDGLAKQRKRKHERRYPGYVFRPQRAGQPNSKRVRDEGGARSGGAGGRKQHQRRDVGKPQVLEFVVRSMPPAQEHRPPYMKVEVPSIFASATPTSFGSAPRSPLDLPLEPVAPQQQRPMSPTLLVPMLGCNATLALQDSCAQSGFQPQAVSAQFSDRLRASGFLRSIFADPTPDPFANFVESHNSLAACFDPMPSCGDYPSAWGFSSPRAGQSPHSSDIRLWGDTDILRAVRQLATPEQIAGHNAASRRGALQGTLTGSPSPAPAVLSPAGLIVIAPALSIEVERRGLEYDMSQWKGGGARLIERHEEQQLTSWKHMVPGPGSMDNHR
ncbi:unnamed protein product [Mycena citricolor]|uniref:Uncharacterized protein n=1 Tax=Mycena citricolor TaxID=2018698 RepID=A0AAD2H6V5_9AGAR|nr:unnamed protein product [Mycena citricolor]